MTTSVRWCSPDISEKMNKKIEIVIVLMAAANALAQDAVAEEEKAELLEGSESQNYGYGYRTKVVGPHGT